MDGVVPNTDPCQFITPLVLLGLGVGVGEGLGVGVGEGVRIRQFKERGNNLAGGRKWAQHRKSRTFKANSLLPRGG